MGRKESNQTNGKCSKISNAFLILVSNKTLIIRGGIHKMLGKIANREDPDQTASSEAVWSGYSLFVPVCLGLFGRQLVFEILEDLLYMYMIFLYLSHCWAAKAQASLHKCTDSSEPLLLAYGSWWWLRPQIKPLISLADYTCLFSRRIVVNYKLKYVHEVLVNCLFKLAQEKVWLGELTFPPWP